ncbi:MAG: M48 family metalloprotease [Desulfuromonadales bacterium]
MFCRLTAAFLSLAVILLAAGGCAVNPATGEQQLMLLSEQDEHQLGQQTDRAVIEEYGLYPDDALQNYVQDLGRQMALISHRPELNWQFRVMDSPVVNAFAAPGGYVYITRGLLAAVANEAELAGVLGHEIGHVTARHSAQQYTNRVMASLGLSFGQSVLGRYGEALGPLLETGTGLLFLKFSRDDEYEADALGVTYATRAGYDTRAMAHFFVTLENQPSPEGEGGQRLPEFFSTHPNPANREVNVRRMAGEALAARPGQPYRLNRDGFLDRIDGLVFGDDPRHGFREDDWFYLPRQRVKLPLPAGWSLTHSGNSLQLSHPEGRAAILMEIHPQARSEQVLAAFVEKTQARIASRRTTVNNGIPVQLVLSTVTNGNQQIVMVSHFYQKDRDVFVFHSMTRDTDFPVMKESMQIPAAGFTAMTDPAKLNRQPQRLRIVKVAQAVTLRQLLQQSGVAEKMWAQIAWLNGWTLDTPIPAGERLKMVR